MPFTIQLQSFNSTLNHIQIIIIFFQKLSDHPFDKPLSVSTSHEKLYPSSLNYTYLVNKYSPTNRHELPDPISYKTQQEQQTSKVTTSSIVSLIKGLATDTIDGNGSVPKRRQNKSMSDELEVAVTVELESDEDLIGDASLSTCPKLSMNTGADIGNLGIGNWTLIETVTLLITVGNWHYSRIRVIGNVVDSITEPRKNNLQFIFIMKYKKYNFISTRK